MLRDSELYLCLPVGGKPVILWKSAIDRLDLIESEPNRSSLGAM